MNDEKRYEYDGWFPGVEGDDTAYGLFWDSENNYRACIKPMERDEAVELWHSVQEEHAAEVKEGASHVGKYIAIGCGLFIGHKLLSHSGAYGKAKSWVQKKFGKKEDEGIIISEE